MKIGRGLSDMFCLEPCTVLTLKKIESPALPSTGSALSQGPLIFRETEMRERVNMLEFVRVGVNPARRATPHLPNRCLQHNLECRRVPDSGAQSRQNPDVDASDVRQRVPYRDTARCRRSQHSGPRIASTILAVFSSKADWKNAALV